MLKLMVPRCISLITTQANSLRAMDAQALADLVRQMGRESVRAIPSPPEAIRQCLAEAEPGDVVCVTGSFFVAGEIYAARGSNEVIPDG